MRVVTRASSGFAGSVPLLRGSARIGHMVGMAEGVKIDVAKLRALVVANTGPGKPWTRRKLSLAASNGRNPDLIRDLMRVDTRYPTIETAAGICAALGVDLSEVVKGLPPPDPADVWLPICSSVAAGVWHEKPDWDPDDCYEVEVGPPIAEGKRTGFLVEGRSMDKTLPPGTILECIELIGSGLVPEDGDYVIAQKHRAGLYERTCKRLRRRPNGDYELVAESTLPEFQEPLFIGHPKTGAFGDDEVSVVALVTRAHLVLHRAKRRPLRNSG